MKNRQHIFILLVILITGCYSQSSDNIERKISEYIASENQEDSAKIMELNDGEYQAYFIKAYESGSDRFALKEVDKSIPAKLWSKKEKELLVSGLERTRNDLIIEIKELSEKQWDFKEDSSRWSIAEIVEHLFAQNESFKIETRTVLNLPELPEFVEKAKENDQVFIDYVADTLKADAGILSPIGRFCSKERAIFAFNRTQDALINMVSTSDKDFRKHFTFRNYVSDGHLSNAEIYNIRDMHQLMLTCIAHMDRHLNQIRKVKSNTGYPDHSSENIEGKISKHIVSIDQEESAKIMDVIKGEYQAYFKKDYEGWSEKFIHEDYLKAWGFWEGYPEKIRQYNTWEELATDKKKRMVNEIKAYWDENKPGMNISEFDIQIRGDVAWITFKQRSTDQETDEFLGKSLETRILEKINGKWKIAYLNFLYLPMEGSDER